MTISLIGNQCPIVMIQSSILLSFYRMKEKGNEGNSTVLFNLIKEERRLMHDDDAICRLFLPSTFSLGKMIIIMRYL